MTITYDDLITLAGQLAASSGPDGEVRYRGSVSRAYYGAFHCAVETLRQFGVHILQNHTGHKQAYRSLHTAPVAEAVEAAEILKDLRGDRNEADYQLQRPRFSKQANAQLCVENATDAINDLRHCLAEPARSVLVAHFSNK